VSTALYVPGSRPDRFDKAAATGAEVILDLEDSVAPVERPSARVAVAEWLRTCTVPVQVRVNRPGSDDLAADLALLPDDAVLRVPKVTGRDDLVSLAGRRLCALIESALGVERAFDIAEAPGVEAIALGEADLAAELSLSGDDGFAWIRSRVVVAAAAAGLPAPMMSAYPAVSDLDGLADSCRAGRELGMWGRTAVHPRQVPVIRAAFEPDPGELIWAERVLKALEGTGVATLEDGSMVDAAMARRARTLLSRRR
jgi:citrate lyase subunit beta/citryl-CoA lyase